MGIHCSSVRRIEFFCLWKMDENGPFIDKLPKIHPIMVNCCYAKLPEGSHGYRQNRRYTMELCLFPLMGNPLPGKSLDVYWEGVGAVPSQIQGCIIMGISSKNVDVEDVTSQTIVVISP